MRKWPKLNFGPNFGQFDPDLGPEIFSWILPLLVVRHCCNLSLYAISRKTNEPNLRKWQKNPNFRPKFGSPKFFSLILPLLHVRHCCKLSLYAISRKTNKPNLRKWQKKPYFRAQFWPLQPTFRPPDSEWFHRTLSN